MLVRLSYVLVILIWATTPLAIKLGGDTLAPIAGLSLRILLAFTVGCVIFTLAGASGLALNQYRRLPPPARGDKSGAAPGAVKLLAIPSQVGQY